MSEARRLLISRRRCRAYSSRGSSEPPAGLQMRHDLGPNSLVCAPRRAGRASI